MTDPHVQALIYRLEPGPGLKFQPSVEPVECEEEDFRGRLEAGALRVEMKRHLSTPEEAHRTLQPYLHAWEISAALSIGYACRFNFVGAEVVDRAPVPGKPPVQALTATQGMYVAGVTFNRAEYPPPPTGLAATPLVETLFVRYQASLEGRV